MSDILVTLVKCEEGYTVEDLPSYSLKPSEFFTSQSSPYFTVEPYDVCPPSSEPLPLSAVPSCSSWFDGAKVHSVEKQSLPEFFCGKYPSKNPTTYMHYRNFMIRTYRENPDQYLTGTACRRALVGDACAIIRIHGFLDKWGLINFLVEPSSRPHPLYQVIVPPRNTRVVRSAEAKWCGYCGDPVYDLWYAHDLLVLCPKCFGEGNFPLILSQDDFVKHRGEHTYTTISTNSSIELFEAVSKYKDDWEKIGKELGRSPAECMWEFAKAPINEITDGKWALRSKDSTSSLCDLSNPLLAEVNTAISTVEVHGVKVHDTISQDLTSINEKIQSFEKSLESLVSAKNSLASLEKFLEKARADFLLHRIHQSKHSQILETPKVFIVKPPKNRSVAPSNL
ncbi:hypothetical protein SteCoe_35755 [Stentor coeruleus]|uniref:Uncharacterized protein n=1 Tax=Stentor coeruleus TaxID=5963 RepID=A0A1R2ARJ3_9CILI|nr:hypothetical protein SteCoe_35755 [Stentor coeruleus]